MNIALNTKDANSIYNVASLVPSSGGGSAELVEVTNGASNTLPSSNAFVYGNLSGASTTTLVLPACSPGLTYTITLTTSDTGNNLVISSPTTNILDCVLTFLGGFPGRANGPAISSVSYNLLSNYVGATFTISSLSTTWVISGYRAVEIV